MSFNYQVILLTAILSSTSILSKAQVDVSNTDSNWIRYSQITARSTKVYDTDRFQGSLYLFDEWKLAEFTLPDESKILVDSVKLNLLRGQVEITLQGKHMGILGSQFNSFSFKDINEEGVLYKSKHYFFMDGRRIPGIIKTINVQDYSVLVAYDPEVRQFSKENPLMIDKMKKDMVRVTKLRFIEKDGVLTRIKNKKDLLKYFDSDKKIKNYISKNKLSHKEEGDIAKVLGFALSNG